MEISQTTQLSKFDGLSKINSVKLQKKLQKAIYNNEDGYGFRAVIGNEKYLTATLIKRVPTFIPQLEPVTNRLVDQEFFLFSEIEFGLDYKYEFLDVFGANKHVSRVISVIYPFIEDEIRIEPLNIVPPRVVSKLGSDFHLTLEKLVVNNFKYKEGVFGRYDVQIEDSKVGLQIIKAYSADISKINIILDIPRIGKTKISISATGSITIKADESDIQQVLNIVKAKLFERKE